MKKMIIPIVLSTLLLTAGCHKNERYFNEVKDDSLLIQLVQLDADKNEPNSLNFKVRLTPDKKLLNKLNSDTKTKLMYNMDSCFYLLVNKQKVYAALTQPIANGVSGTYEYLLSYETDKPVDADSIRLAYQDKFIDHKVYTITSEAK